MMFENMGKKKFCHVIGLNFLSYRQEMSLLVESIDDRPYCIISVLSAWKIRNEIHRYAFHGAFGIGSGCNNPGVL